MIDDGIEQCVGEIIILVFAQLATARADASRTGSKTSNSASSCNVIRNVLPRNMLTCSRAHDSFLIEIKHLRDDEEVIAVLLDLRALAGIEHIFQCQRMQVKPFAEHAENFDVAEPVDIDPGDQFIVEMRKKFARIAHDVFVEMFRIVLDQGNDGRLVGDFLVNLQHSRRLTRDGIASLKHVSSSEKIACPASRKSQVANEVVRYC